MSTRNIFLSVSVDAMRVWLKYAIHGNVELELWQDYVRYDMIRYDIYDTQNYW